MLIFFLLLKKKKKGTHLGLSQIGGGDPASASQKKSLGSCTERSPARAAAARFPSESRHIRVKGLTQGGRGSAAPLMFELHSL